MCCTKISNKRHFLQSKDTKETEVAPFEVGNKILYKVCHYSFLIKNDISQDLNFNFTFEGKFETVSQYAVTKRRSLELISWIHHERSKFSPLFPEGVVVMSQRRSQVVAHSYLAITTYFCSKNMHIIGFHPTVRRCFTFPCDSLGI